MDLRKIKENKKLVIHIVSKDKEAIDKIKKNYPKAKIIQHGD